MTMESFLKGLLVGSLAGLAAGILYAPKSGKETRQQIVDSADKMRKKIASLAEHEKKSLCRKQRQAKECCPRGCRKLQDGQSCASTSESIQPL